MMGNCLKNRKRGGGGERDAGWHATHNQLNGTNKYLPSKNSLMKTLIYFFQNALQHIKYYFSIFQHTIYNYLYIFDINERKNHFHPF
jgi:hypothetical protein